MQPTSRSSGGPGLKWFIVLVVLVCLLWWFFGWFALVQKHADAGTFGDMFGAANALFSALAFAALIYTVLLQRDELKLQRLELAETRAELKGQREQLELQSELMRADGFENSFFRVLTVLSDIVNAIDLTSTDHGQMRGRDCFRVFYDRFRRLYEKVRKAGTQSANEAATTSYAKFYETAQGDVGHYFRTLYNLVKLVDRSSVEDKHFYTNLIRAQLSNQETLLLFYNCVAGDGRDKFKPLVERYALLKNMPREQLISPEHLKWFEPSAFGKEFVSEQVGDEPLTV